MILDISHFKNENFVMESSVSAEIKGLAGVDTFIFFFCLLGSSFLDLMDASEARVRFFFAGVEAEGILMSERMNRRVSLRG